MDKEGILTWSVDEIEVRLKLFLESSFIIPKWSVHIHEEYNKEILSHGNHIENISQFDFYKVNQGYAIGRYVRGMITAFAISPEDFSNSELFFSTKIDNFNIRDIAVPLNQCFRYRVTYCRGIMMHASAVICDGKAILFTGVSGAGKSTQANLWMEYASAEILNYDQVLIFSQGNEIMVCGTPWAGKENIYMSGMYPLHAIVLPEKAADNSVVELSKGEAFSRVYLNNYLYPLSEKIDECYCDSISFLISEIPVYELKNNISEEAVDCLYRKLFIREL